MKKACADELEARNSEYREWRASLEAVYAEFGVLRETRNFCWLYVEKEVYCINEVIRIRREMLGITRKQLCGRIVCSEKTLGCLESRGKKIQKEIVRDLMKQLNLSAEYCRAELITDDPEAVKIMSELRDRLRNWETEQAGRLLEQLKGRISLEILSNRQAWMDSQALNEAYMEMGKINGKLYGMATDFALYTVVVNDPDLEDWDYDVFMQCAEDRPGLEALFNMYGGNYGPHFITSFLSHGLEDNYFLDGGTGKMVFDSSKFRKALGLAEKYCVRGENEEVGLCGSLLEGKVLCNTLTIYKPEHFALYRTYYGEDIQYIGYPTKDGGTHFMSTNSMLSIRRSATKEEKEAAAAFISLYLSHEGQLHAAQALNFNLSVRKDVLEEQIASINGSIPVGVAGLDQIRLGANLDRELDRQMMFEMIDIAKPEKKFPNELQDIMYDELDAYFSGDITEDMLVGHLESRVGLYLGERD